MILSLIISTINV